MYFLSLKDVKYLARKQKFLSLCACRESIKFQTCVPSLGIRVEMCCLRQCVQSYGSRISSLSNNKFKNDRLFQVGLLSPHSLSERLYSSQESGKLTLLLLTINFTSRNLKCILRVFVHPKYNQEGMEQTKWQYQLSDMHDTFPNLCHHQQA